MLRIKELNILSNYSFENIKEIIYYHFLQE